MCLQLGDILCDRYHIRAELGRGGFGVTYLARDLALLDCPLRAVKEIPFPQSDDEEVLKKARRDFARETDALECLGQHPQIPKLYDRCENNRNFYLVQEYIEGHAMTEEFPEGQPWFQDNVVAFLRDILKVLQFVHQHGVIHRDLKPSNLIRRDSDRKIVLIDFGAVREISNLDTTHSGSVVTTQAIFSQGYTPPEQLRHPEIRQPYNDIYAAGTIAIQGLTGLNPNQFPPDKPTGEIIWCFSTPDRPMVTVDTRLEAILNQMIRYHFNHRYPSVEEILEDLQDLDLSESEAGVPAIASDGNPSEQMSGNTHSTSMDSTSPTHSNSPGERRSRRVRWGLLAVVMVAGSIALYRICRPKTYRLEAGDGLSVGEEILLTNVSPFPKKRGVDSIARCRSNGLTLPILFRLTNVDRWQNCFGEKLNYKDALKNFRQTWNDTRDPETLIYLNNAFLEIIDADAYTLSVSVPIRRDESGNIINSDVAKELLQGVAQAQMEVNLALFDGHRALKIDGWEAVSNNAIDENGKIKGLRVIIADDANQVDRSKSVATSLAKVPNLLGNIGHYASEITVETIDIYEENELITISPASTSSSLSPGGSSGCSSEDSNDFFLRTIHSTSTQAAALVDFLIQDLGLTQAAVFYNENSAYSYCFWKDFKVLFELKGGTIAFADGNLHKTDEFNAIRANQKVRGKEDMAIVLMPDGEVTDSIDNAIETIVANGDRNWILGGWALYNQKILQKVAQLPSQKKLAITVPWHPLTSPNSEFPEAARQLWGESVSGNTALAYDAARALIQAIRLQDRPTRRGMQQTLRGEENLNIELTACDSSDSSTPSRDIPPSDVPFTDDNRCSKSASEDEPPSVELKNEDEENEFIARGATGEIRFNPQTGNRRNLEAKWVRIVPCKTESSELAFVPFEDRTAAAAGLQCEATEASGATQTGGEN